MGNFLTDFANNAKKKAVQFEQSFNSAPRPAAPAPAPAAPQFSPLAQQRIMARNPSGGAAQIAHGPVMPSTTPIPRFNPITAIPGAFKDAVGSLSAPVVNTAQVPFSAGRVVAANLTHNQPALNNAHKALASDTANNMLWNDAYRQTSNELAGAIRENPTLNHLVGHQTDLEKNHAANVKLGNTIAQAYGNSPRAQQYGSLVSSANDQNDINRTLGNVGLTPTMSRTATGIRLGAPIVSAGAQTALNVTGAGKGAAIAADVAAKQAAKLTAEQAAKKATGDLLKTSLKYGTTNAGISMLSPASQGSTNAMDYVKAGASGFAGGAAMPILGAGLSKGGAPILKAAGKLTNERIGAAKDNIALNDGITSQNRQLANEIASHQKQQAALPIGTDAGQRAHEVLQRKIDTKTAQIAQNEARRPQQNILQKATDRVLTAQPGMSMKAVTTDATPAEVLPHEAVPQPVPEATGTGGVSSGNGTTKLNVNGRIIGKNKDGSPIYEPGIQEQRNGSTPKITRNSLTQGAKAGRQNISPETQVLTEGEHAIRNTEQLAKTSAANVDKLPTNTAIEQAHTALAQPLGHVTDEQTGFIAKTIEKTDAEATKARQAGNTIEADRLSREAAALHDGLSEHAVARGQANQALTMLYNRSPQGLYHSAIRDLNRAGVEVTPELQTKLQGLTDAIKTAPDRATKTDALGNFHKAVSDTMPQNIGDKAIGIWKAGLLSGVKTQQGNAISNATFGALKKISDVPATAVDKLMSVFTGKRTKTLTGRGIGQGTAEGSRNGIHTMKTGIDRRGAGDKYEQHAEINFKHPVLNKTLGTAVRTVFRGMNAADQPFWYAAFKNSMYDQAKAAGISKGLKGAGLKQFMEETVRNPNDAMANTALKEANKSTLNYDTLGSKAVQGMHKAIDNFPGATKQGKAIAHGVINVLAPFVRVPTAFLSRTVDFTPLGVGKEVFHQVASGKFDQRALSQAIGEGITGTGVIALGVALTQHNMLSGDYPKNDPKEAQRWKAEGITPNSVKLGNKWVSLNYLGPLGLLFNAGNKLENAKGQGSANQAGQAIAGFGQGLMGQSFLQGFSGFSNAIQDPQRNLKSFINSQAGSVIPNISNDVANATDSMQRQSNNAIQSIESRIPGVRNKKLQPKQDVYGNPLKQPAGALGTLIGVKPSNDLTTNNPVTSEVSRLHTVDPNNTDLQVTPTPITSVTIPGANKGDKSTTVKLNDKQKYAIQTQVGQNIQSTWDKLIKTPQYQAMSDTEKAKELTNARQDATELASRKYVIDNNLGSYSKSASKGAQALSSGNLDKYTNGTTGGTIISSKIDPHSQKVLNEYNGLSSDQIKQKAYKENDYDYKVAQAKYENDKANNKLSKSQLISRADTVRKAQVGSGFSKDTRDIYGLSKNDVYNLITTDPNGKQIASDLLAYGDALQKNGIENNKYRTLKTGAEAFKPKTTVGQTSTASSRHASQMALLKAFKTPYSDLVKSQSKGAQLARSATLGKKRA